MGPDPGDLRPFGWAFRLHLAAAESGEESIMNPRDRVTPQSAGALTFSPDGVLFVGDSKLGAVFAFETGRGQAPSSLDPFLFESIDEKIAAALGVAAKAW